MTCIIQDTQTRLTQLYAMFTYARAVTCNIIVIVRIVVFRRRKVGDFLRVSAVRGARTVPRPALRRSSRRRVVVGRAVVLHDHRHDALRRRQHGRAQAVHTGRPGGNARVDVAIVEIAHW